MSGISVTHVACHQLEMFIDQPFDYGPMERPDYFPLTYDGNESGYPYVGQPVYLPPYKQLRQWRQDRMNGKPPGRSPIMMGQLPQDVNQATVLDDPNRPAPGPSPMMDPSGAQPRMLFDRMPGNLLLDRFPHYISGFGGMAKGFANRESNYGITLTNAGRPTYGINVGRRNAFNGGAGGAGDARVGRPNVGLMDNRPRNIGW